MGKRKKRKNQAKELDIQTKTEVAAEKALQNEQTRTWGEYRQAWVNFLWGNAKPTTEEEVQTALTELDATTQEVQEVLEEESEDEANEYADYLEDSIDTLDRQLEATEKRAHEETHQIVSESLDDVVEQSLTIVNTTLQGPKPDMVWHIPLASEVLVKGMRQLAEYLADAREVRQLRRVEEGLALSEEKPEHEQVEAIVKNINQMQDQAGEFKDVTLPLIRQLAQDSLKQWVRGNFQVIFSRSQELQRQIATQEPEQEPEKIVGALNGLLEAYQDAPVPRDNTEVKQSLGLSLTDVIQNVFGLYQNIPTVRTKFKEAIDSVFLEDGSWSELLFPFEVEWPEVQSTPIPHPQVEEISETEVLGNHDTDELSLAEKGLLHKKEENSVEQPAQTQETEVNDQVTQTKVQSEEVVVEAENTENKVHQNEVKDNVEKVEARHSNLLVEVKATIKDIRDTLQLYTRGEQDQIKLENMLSDIEAFYEQVWDTENPLTEENRKALLISCRQMLKEVDEIHFEGKGTHKSSTWLHALYVNVVWFVRACLNLLVTLCTVGFVQSVNIKLPTTEKEQAIIDGQKTKLKDTLRALEKALGQVEETLKAFDPQAILNFKNEVNGIFDRMEASAEKIKALESQLLELADALSQSPEQENKPGLKEQLLQAFVLLQNSVTTYNLTAETECKLQVTKNEVQQRVEGNTNTPVTSGELSGSKHAFFGGSVSADKSADNTKEVKPNLPTKPPLP